MSNETRISDKGAKRAAAVVRELLAARKRLAEAALDSTQDPVRLNNHVQEIAFLEGKHYVLSEIGQMQDHGVAKAAQVTYVLRMLSQSPDDTWSGRGNDTKRAYNDGLRETVNRMLYSDFDLDAE